MENIGRWLKVFPSFYLGKREETYKIAGVCTKELVAGKYECEIVAILWNGKKVEKKFSFTLDKEQINFLNSGDVLNIPVDKMFKMVQDL